MIRLDHLAIAASDLATGAAAIEAALGVPLAPGGQHAGMGTHNRLLSLGPEIYLEVIAIDPAAPPPGRARWFDLDRFEGVPCLTTWIARCDDLEATLASAPAGMGEPIALQRGDLSWRMAVPQTGQLPFDGVVPALMEWQGDAHPARRLPDRGCRLTRLSVTHPRMDVLRRDWPAVSGIENITLAVGDTPALSAEIETPAGTRWLRSADVLL